MIGVPYRYYGVWFSWGKKIPPVRRTDSYIDYTGLYRFYFESYPLFVAILRALFVTI